MDSRILGLLALAVAIVIGGAVAISGGTVDDDGPEVKPREDRHLDADDERPAEMVAPGVAHTSRYTEPESHDREDYVPDWRDDAIASLEAELRKEQELREAAEQRLRLIEAERSKSLVEEFLKTDVARSLTDKQREAVPYFIKRLGRIPDDWIVRKLAEHAATYQKERWEINREFVRMSQLGPEERKAEMLKFRAMKNVIRQRQLRRLAGFLSPQDLARF